jgi:CRP-like cAMP-binding protein
LSGSTRETVTRTLSDFKDRSLITLRGGALTIQNHKALEQTAVA